MVRPKFIRRGDLVSTGVIADMFGINEKTVIRWTDEGLIPEDCFFRLPDPSPQRRGELRFSEKKMLEIKKNGTLTRRRPPRKK